MATRAISSLLFVILLTSLLPAAISAQQRDAVHDQQYISPSWGYTARWYGDEWTVEQETSEDGADSLWLSDSSGDIVGFEGGPGYGGDAAACLADLITSVEQLPGATDIAVVQDEVFAPQESWDPRWSWIMLLVRLPDNDLLVDTFLFLDCRTLASDEAVLSRILAAPAATFQEEDERFEIMRVTLPRGAWLVDPDLGLLVAGTGDPYQSSRFDDTECGGFPRRPQRLFSSDGAEWGTTTLVDGAQGFTGLVSEAGMTRILMIENSGAAPLTIAPADFSYVDASTEAVARADGIWDDTGTSEERHIPPGSWAMLWLTYPSGAALPEQGAYLVYQDGELRDGEVTFDSVGMAGGCGGGGRLPLRLSR